MTRQDIADRVFDEKEVTGVVNISHADVAVLAVLHTMRRGLIEDSVLYLRLFGTFYIRSKNARAGRNPKTMEPAMISARKVVVFRASPSLKALVNGDRKYRRSRACI